MARELERLGDGGMDYLVLGIDAPGFESLTPAQRSLCYFLFRAAVAGDRIYTDQNHRHALEIQELLEEIHLHGEGLPAPVREAVHDHLKYLWINHGQYDAENHTKIVPRGLTPAMLAEAASHAASRGASLGAAGGRDLEAKLA